MVGACIVYISQLQTKLVKTSTENIKVLDRMHEGVLIFSKETQSVIFCNEPA